MKRILLIPFLFALLSIQLFSYEEFIDPNPSSENGFGDNVVVLPNGNVVVTSPSTYKKDKEDCGEVYLYNGKTHKLISSLYGSSAKNFIGSGGIVVLNNSNYLVCSPFWDNGDSSDVGAVTWCNGTTGTSGTVSENNSIIGSSTDDRVGYYNSYDKPFALALENGNYVVCSPYWDNEGSNDVGAVTWGDGNKGTKGAINASNSLIGSKSLDRISLITSGSDAEIGVKVLKNGNYVVFSPFWDNGDSINVGAVTWADGTVGITGKISETNSLIGSTSEDRIGCFSITPSSNDYNDENAVQISELKNGNYVLLSPLWDNGGGVNAGAATWASGTKGICGKINSNNSLISNNTKIDYNHNSLLGITLLNNDNYIISNPGWINSEETQHGAVTWCNGSIGTCGLVSIENSLVGNQYCTIGDGDIVALKNGNYVVISPSWSGNFGSYSGAVTWCDGSKMVTGKISVTNSLVYKHKPDWSSKIEITLLNNDNYIVSDKGWNYGQGAVTWCNGKIGTFGVVSSANSLVGSSEGDWIGSDGIITLNNGNYLVCSPNWHNGDNLYSGALTWGNGNKGISGIVTAYNSLVGEKYEDNIGKKYSISTLNNGNYVINIPEWTKNNSIENGAVTWVKGTNGIRGNLREVISETNSLIGTFGSANITELQNGNFVVSCINWGFSWTDCLGAITLCDGTKGTFGKIGTDNSFIGSKENDRVGSRGVYPLTNGNFVVSSPNCSNGDSLRVGAVTWLDGTKVSTGILSSSNSLVGSSTDDVGYVFTLSNGNYLVVSSYWNNGDINDAGAITWGSGTKGVSGVISAANSLVGTGLEDQIGYDPSYNSIIELKNNNYVVVSDEWNEKSNNNNYGAVTVGNGNIGICGEINSKNSMTSFNTISLDIIKNDAVSEFYIEAYKYGWNSTRKIYIMSYDGLASASVATDSTQNYATNTLSFSAEYPYPNPVNNSFTTKLKLIEDGNITVQICDVTGRVIQNLFSDELFIGIHNLTFDISSIRSGAYHLVISKDGESLSFPIQIVR